MNVEYSAIENTDASEEMLSLNAFCAVALYGNKGYYECIAGQPSMPLYGILQMGDSGAFVNGAPVQLIQTPEEAIYLLEGTESKAGPGQPTMKLLPSTIINGKEVPTTPNTVDGNFATAFEFDAPGTAFIALKVGNYEHIPFEVIVHPAGFNTATLAPKKNSFVNFFKHLVGK